MPISDDDPRVVRRTRRFTYNANGDPVIVERVKLPKEIGRTPSGRPIYGPSTEDLQQEWYRAHGGSDFGLSSSVASGGPLYGPPTPWALRPKEQLSIYNQPSSSTFKPSGGWPGSTRVPPEFVDVEVPFNPTRSENPFTEIFGRDPGGPEYEHEVDLSAIIARYKRAKPGELEDIAEEFRSGFASLPSAIKVEFLHGAPGSTQLPGVTGEDILDILHRGQDRYAQRYAYMQGMHGNISRQIEITEENIRGAQGPYRDELRRHLNELYLRQREYAANKSNMLNEFMDIHHAAGTLEAYSGQGIGLDWRRGDSPGLRMSEEDVMKELQKNEAGRLRSSIYTRDRFLELHAKGIIHDYMNIPGPGPLGESEMIPGAPFMNTVSRNAMMRGEEYEISRLIGPGEYRYPELAGVSDWTKLPPWYRERIGFPGEGKSFILPQAKEIEAVIRPRSMASEYMMRHIQVGMAAEHVMMPATGMPGEGPMYGPPTPYTMRPMEDTFHGSLRGLDELSPGLVAKSQYKVSRAAGTMGDRYPIRIEDAIESVNRRVSNAVRHNVAMSSGSPFTFDFQGDLQNTTLHDFARSFRGNAHERVRELEAEIQREEFHAGRANSGYLLQKKWELVAAKREARKIEKSFIAHPMTSRDYTSELIGSLISQSPKKRSLRGGGVKWDQLLDWVLDPNHPHGAPIRQELMQTLGVTESQMRGKGRKNILRKAARERAKTWGIPQTASALEQSIYAEQNRMFEEGQILRDLETPASALIEGASGTAFRYEDPELARVAEEALIKERLTPARLKEYQRARKLETHARRLFREEGGGEEERLAALEYKARADAIFRRASSWGEFEEEPSVATAKRVLSPSEISRRARYISSIADLDETTAQSLESHLLKSGGYGQGSPFFGLQGDIYSKLQELKDTEARLSLTLPGVEGLVGEEDPLTVMARLSDVTPLQWGVGRPERIGVRYELEAAEKERALRRMAYSKGIPLEELDAYVSHQYMHGGSLYEERALRPYLTRPLIDPEKMTRDQLIARAQQLGTKTVDAAQVHRNVIARKAEQIKEEAKVRYSLDNDLERYQEELARANRMRNLSIDDMAIADLRNVVTGLEADRLRAAGLDEEAELLEGYKSYGLQPDFMNPETTNLGMYVSEGVSDYSERTIPLSRLSPQVVALEDAAVGPANITHQLSHISNLSIQEHLEDLTRDAGQTLLVDESGRINRHLFPGMPEFEATSQNVIEDVDKILREQYGTSVEELSRVSHAFLGREYPGSRDIFGQQVVKNAVETEGVSRFGDKVAAPFALNMQMIEPGQHARPLSDFWHKLVMLRQQAEIPHEELPPVWRTLSEGYTHRQYEESTARFAEGLADYHRRIQGSDFLAGPKVPSKMRDRITPILGPPTPRGFSEAAREAAEEAAPRAERAAEREAPTLLRDVWKSVYDSPNRTLRKVAIGLLAIGGLGVARSMIQHSQRKKETNEQTVQGPPGMPGGNPYEGMGNPYTYPVPPTNPYGNSGNTGVTYMINASGVANPQSMIQGAGRLTGSNPSGVVYYAPTGLNSSYQNDPNIQGLLQ